jgi:hypothetical protein
MSDQEIIEFSDMYFNLRLQDGATLQDMKMKLFGLLGRIHKYRWANDFRDVNKICTRIEDILTYAYAVSPSIQSIKKVEDRIKLVVDKARDYENLEVFCETLRKQYYIVFTYLVIFSKDPRFVTYENIYEEVRLDGKADLYNRSYGTCAKVFKRILEVTVRYSLRKVSYDECNTLFTSTWNHPDSINKLDVYLYKLLLWLYGKPREDDQHFIIEDGELKVYLPDNHDDNGDVRDFVKFQSNHGMIVGTQLFTAIEGPTYVTVMRPPIYVPDGKKFPIFLLMGETHGPTGAPGTCADDQNSFTNPAGCKARVDDQIFYDAFNSISSYERPTDMTIESFLPQNMKEMIANFELPSNEAVSKILSMQSELDEASIIHRINLRFYPCFFRAQRNSQKFATANPKCPDNVRFQYADIRMPSSYKRFFENIFGCMVQFVLEDTDGVDYKTLLEFYQTITDGQATFNIIDVFVRAIYCMSILIGNSSFPYTSKDAMVDSFVDAISAHVPSNFSILAKQYSKLSIQLPVDWIVTQWKTSMKLYMTPYSFDFNDLLNNKVYFFALWGHLFDALGFTNCKRYYAPNTPFYSMIEHLEYNKRLYSIDDCSQVLKAKYRNLFIDAMSPMLDLYYLFRCFKQVRSVDASSDVQEPWIQLSYFGSMHTVNLQRILMEEPFNYTIEFDSLPSNIVTPEDKANYIAIADLPRTVPITKTINMNGGDQG